MSVAYPSTCRPTIGQPLSVDISTNILDECQSTYRPMLDQHVGRYIEQHISVDASTTLDQYVDLHIGRHSANMLTNTSVDCRPICQPIRWSRGVQNTHDPNKSPRRIKCTKDIRDRVSIDTLDRLLDRPSIDTPSTSRSILHRDSIDISVASRSTNN